MDSLIGLKFGGCRLESVLGRGGMGVVYQATQEMLERPVAVKVIAPEVGRDDDFRARFRHEARLVARLEHPGILPVHAAGEQDGRLYLVMRLVDGEDLQARLERETRLPPAEACRILKAVASALDAAHAANVVHRDVKPGNVLLEKDGEHVFLSDFGLATPTGGAEGAVGSVQYIAPEQLLGREVDARADVYSLGCLLFHMLTGQVPFSGGHQMATLLSHLNESPPSARALVPDLPADFDRVLARALAKDPEERFTSAGELAAAARETLRRLLPPSVLLGSIAGYRLLSLLGRGVGHTYRATDTDGTPVALRVLDHPVNGIGDPDRRHFESELSRLHGLRHPNIAQILAFGAEGGQLWVAQRFVEAPSLAELLRGGPLRPRRVAAIVRDIAWALDAARAIEVLHREVRPWHVFLEPTREGERAVLTGFGLTAPDLVHGSAREVPPGYEYAAPEVLRGEPVTPRSDIYSLGAVAARAMGPRPACAAALRRATAEPSADRFASAGAFAAALTAAVA